MTSKGPAAAGTPFLFWKQKASKLRIWEILAISLMKTRFRR